MAMRPDIWYGASFSQRAVVFGIKDFARGTIVPTLHDYNYRLVLADLDCDRSSHIAQYTVNEVSPNHATTPRTVKNFSIYDYKKHLELIGQAVAEASLFACGGGNQDQHIAQCIARALRTRSLNLPRLVVIVCDRPHEDKSHIEKCVVGLLGSSNYQRYRDKVVYVNAACDRIILPSKKSNASSLRGHCDLDVTVEKYADWHIEAARVPQQSLASCNWATSCPDAKWYHHRHKDNMKLASYVTHYSNPHKIPHYFHEALAGEPLKSILRDALRDLNLHLTRTAPRQEKFRSYGDHLVERLANPGLLVKCAPSGQENLNCIIMSSGLSAAARALAKRGNRPSGLLAAIESMLRCALMRQDQDSAEMRKTLTSERDDYLTTQWIGCRRNEKLYRWVAPIIKGLQESGLRPDQILAPSFEPELRCDHGRGQRGLFACCQKPQVVDESLRFGPTQPLGESAMPTSRPYPSRARIPPLSQQPNGRNDVNSRGIGRSGGNGGSGLECSRPGSRVRAVQNRSTRAPALPGPPGMVGVSRNCSTFQLGSPALSTTQATTDYVGARRQQRDGSDSRLTPVSRRSTKASSQVASPYQDVGETRSNTATTLASSQIASPYESAKAKSTTTGPTARDSPSQRSSPHQRRSKGAPGSRSSTTSNPPRAATMFGQSDTKVSSAALSPSSAGKASLLLEESPHETLGRIPAWDETMTGHVSATSEISPMARAKPHPRGDQKNSAHRYGSTLENTYIPPGGPQRPNNVRNAARFNFEERGPSNAYVPPPPARLVEAGNATQLFESRAERLARAGRAEDGEQEEQEIETVAPVQDGAEEGNQLEQETKKVAQAQNKAGPAARLRSRINRPQRSESNPNKGETSPPRKRAQAQERAQAQNRAQARKQVGQATRWQAQAPGKSSSPGGRIPQLPRVFRQRKTARDGA